MWLLYGAPSLPPSLSLSPDHQTWQSLRPISPPQKTIIIMWTIIIWTIRIWSIMNLVPTSSRPVLPPTQPVLHLLLLQPVLLVLAPLVSLPMMSPTMAVDLVVWSGDREVWNRDVKSQRGRRVTWNRDMESPQGGRVVWNRDVERRRGDRGGVVCGTEEWEWKEVETGGQRGHHETLC